MDGLRAVPKRGLRRWRKSAVAGQSRDTDFRGGSISAPRSVIRAEQWQSERRQRHPFPAIGVEVMCPLRRLRPPPTRKVQLRQPEGFGPAIAPADPEDTRPKLDNVVRAQFEAAPSGPMNHVIHTTGHGINFQPTRANGFANVHDLPRVKPCLHHRANTAVGPNLCTCHRQYLPADLSPEDTATHRRGPGRRLVVWPILFCPATGPCCCAPCPETAERRCCPDLPVLALSADRTGGMSGCLKAQRTKGFSGLPPVLPVLPVLLES